MTRAIAAARPLIRSAMSSLCGGGPERRTPGVSRAFSIQGAGRAASGLFRGALGRVRRGRSAELGLNVLRALEMHLDVRPSLVQQGLELGRLRGGLGLIDQSEHQLMRGNLAVDVCLVPRGALV